MRGNATKSEERTRRSVGRPRLLSLNDVVEAAIELGPERLTMSALAIRLGVGIATLYNYVDNLETLKRLVAIQQGGRPRLHDVGQHWSEIIADCTRTVFGIFRAEPHLIAQFAEGALEPSIDDIDAFLGLLTRRGFSDREAMRLYRVTNYIALGAAIGAANTVRLQMRGIPLDRTIPKQLIDGGPGTFPNLRRCVDDYVKDEHFLTAEEGVAFLIESIAAQRGEALPPSKTRRTVAHSKQTEG